MVLMLAVPYRLVLGGMKTYVRTIVAIVGLQILGKILATIVSVAPPNR